MRMREKRTMGTEEKEMNEGNTTAEMEQITRKEKKGCECYQSTGIMIDRQIITSHDKHELIDWLFIFEIFKCDFHSIKSKETVYDYSDTTKRVRLD